VPRNLKKKKPFLFLDLLSAVAKVLSMYCFSDKYGYGVGSYLLDLLGAVAKVLTICCFFWGSLGASLLYWHNGGS
jgi:hypothetical protein